MGRGLVLGLRAQIVVALSVAFIASFSLLAITTVQLVQGARSLDRAREARETVTRLARRIDQAGLGRGAEFRTSAASLQSHGGITGFEIRRGQRTDFASGAKGEHSASAKLANGDELLLYFEMPPPIGASPVFNLLLLYFGVTGGGILLLAYLVLTYLIVRPLEKVTQASERLASGSPFVSVPERGAAETVRLAVAFNEMARQLKAERSNLQRRLAELEKTTSELSVAQEQLIRSEKLASVGRLSAGVAHEIGNPLAAILGMLEILESGGTEPAEQREFLARIQSETERIHKIIRNLLDYSRRSDDQEGPSEADLGAVVEDAVRLIAPQKDLRKVTMERRIAEDLPLAPIDAEQLTQVVLNLLLNAADAIAGEGTIVVDVYKDDDEGRLVLAVSDTGPGFDPQVIEHMFEPFVTTKPAGEGTGLGLAVCHTIVDRVRGTIVAHNLPEGGARMEVRLPVPEKK
ncbi:MAG: HAMP domain-containing protein [Myxococcales bacterium]|nr:HAMP domain-containing protein [Myxococcales bacterium]